MLTKTKVFNFLQITATSALVAAPCVGVNSGVLYAGASIDAVAYHYSYADPVPGQDGFFNGLGLPAMNGKGHVAFHSPVHGSIDSVRDDQGIFLGGGGSDLMQVARAGQVTPDGEGRLHILGIPVLNDAGQTAFKGDFLIPGGNVGPLNPGGYLGRERGIFLSESSRGLIHLARTGETIPDGSAVFDDFSSPYINNQGQAAFAGFMQTTESSIVDEGIFRGDGISDLIQIARTGQSAPDGNGNYYNFFNPAMNERGQVVFQSYLTGFSPESYSGLGVFLWDSEDGTVQVARQAQPAPDGDGALYLFGSMALNDIGQVAFHGVLSGTDKYGGMFIVDSDGGLSQIARTGQVIPDGNGRFDRNFICFGLSNQGQTVFSALLNDTSGGDGDNYGIFRGDGLTSLEQVARTGQAVPNGNGVFATLGNPAINDNGQVAFSATLRGTNAGDSDQHAIFLYDDQSGLTEVMRTGDSYFGAKIMFLDFGRPEFSHRSGDIYNRRLVFNDAGQLALEIVLDDWRRMLAVVSIPEPSSLTLILVGLSCLRFRRRGSN